MIKQAAWVFLTLGLTACSGMDHSTLPSDSGVSETLLEDKPAEWSDSYAGNPEVQGFIDRLVKEHNYDRKRLELAFSHIKVRPKVIEKSDNQPEVLIPYYEYKTRFVNEERAKLGRQFAKRNADWLQKAEQEFGVEPRIIVALIGVETYYGRITGSRDVFTSLTTLAFDYPRRKAYFQSELEAYLLLARQEEWNIGATKGSYSGAMGMVQFMPSNYQKLAVDYDENGHVDLWGSDADAIGSVANYLKHHGWQKGQPWFVMAYVADAEKVKDEINRGREPSKDMVAWSALGVLPAQSFIAQKTGLIALRTGPEEVSYWLGYENFFTIMDYNPSRRYAMSVLELAESIGNDERY
ncbi:lytic murein transglycosylase B [Marinomonas sp. M1K-6]|uniref:Lytic murein transglycosylase B n=2 Tax=Marinomonas profundi TaxID=2726122 RepID=A0A847R2K6_9GAMM|nr:lytic murein transglycosylase B [Marinomonas profundi]NLQ16096.1 lytic murein transglycosylase B [Marinomonas profundi]UDV04773.1 lytic murein transglycosylase B [Marinomonas profundi]